MIVDFRRNPPALPPLTIIFIHSRSETLTLTLEEVQPATVAAETVRLSCLRVCPVHFNNCLVWLSYKIRHQKTTENGSDCGDDFWCSSAHCILYTSKVRKIAQKITLDPSHHFLNFCHLQSPKYQDSQAQERFFTQGIYLITAKYFPHCAIKICAITLY